MATSGLFTYHDLYAGRPESYHHRKTFRLLSSDTTQISPTLTTVIDTLSSTIVPIESNSSTTIEYDNKLKQFVQQIPFTYFHWFLIGLAALLALLLTVVFTYYCRSYCRKHKRSCEEKKQPFPSFYRFRKNNQPGKANNVFNTTSLYPFPSPTRPCPVKPIDRRNSRLLREGLDAVGSPHVSRTDVSQTEPSSSSASDLLAEIKGRLSIHSSKAPQEKKTVYETQRANMALTDDVKDSSLLVDIN
ncbi:unnamed protein product [Adineta ricciae]|uniref:Uncharacterized protein n=1 Tax=Adineta ricciae TaxID=249248 RepID=A0A814RVN3_ADIRI|nr:unnamed protein product [Adineta ricciae]CAF1138003.1 unnamed protein product [Adineta ricciae]